MRPRGGKNAVGGALTQTSIYCLHSVASVVEHLAHQLVFKGMRLIDPALEQGQLRLKHLTHRFSSLE
jgi:hypothetical protein